jgi:hypothetical protein
MGGPVCETIQVLRENVAAAGLRAVSDARSRSKLLTKKAISRRIHINRAHGWPCCGVMAPAVRGMISLKNGRNLTFVIRILNRIS